jgi:pyrimidine deaminase RibD-like protein
LNESQIRTLLGRAVRLAARGHGGAEPNPMVGCVIVDVRGEVISEGFHRRCGGPHAEVDALAAAGERARGATAIVTLEPCAHRGRTGPCTDALRAAGIARVLYAVADPNPLAAGGGAQLSASGIQAELFPHDGARELVLPFVKRVQTGLPWINPSPNMRTLNAALLYPGIGLLEFSVSVGRGTDTPFEVLGAPYVNDLRLAHELNKLGLAGVQFTPVRFTPTTSLFKGETCGGVRIAITDRPPA